MDIAGGTGRLPRVSYGRSKMNSAENRPSACGGWYCRFSSLVSIALVVLFCVPPTNGYAEEPSPQPSSQTVYLKIDDVDFVYKDDVQESTRVSVPVRISGDKQANLVQLSVDFDRDQLTFRQLEIEYGQWILWPGVPVTVDPEGRVVATLLNLGGELHWPEGEQSAHFISLVFDVIPGNFPAEDYFIRSPLDFTPFDPQSLSQGPLEESIAAHLDIENEELIVRAMPTALDNGSLNIFYANGVEIGGGGMTHREQSLVLPLYLTHLADIDFIGVGVDYDELILNLTAVRPLGLSNARGEPAPQVSVFYRTNPAGADFTLDLRGLGDPGTGYLLREHVADLEFHYSGPGEAGDGMGQGGFGNHVGGALVIQPFVRPNGGEGVAAGNQELRMLSGYLRILRPHFVRGNVDSSILNYDAPERGQSIASESYRTAPDLGDPVKILRWLFWPEDGRQTIRCMEAADANDDGMVQIDDAILLLTTLFIGGTEPAAPFPYPGPDPAGSIGNLGCDLPLPVFMGE